MSRNVVVPWITTPIEVIAYALSLANIDKTDIVYDLGCGDGRVPIIAARHLGAQGVCIEINDNLCALAEANAQYNHVDKKVRIVCEDMFNTELSSATVIFSYLYSSINKMLSKKLETETKEMTRIITVDMPIPNWVPFTIRRINDKNGVLRTIFLYIKGISNPSAWRIAIENEE